MTMLIVVFVVIALCSIPCWLTWRQTQANHVDNKKLLWAMDEFKTILISREHEAGYVAGTADEREVGAERAADVAAVAVTVAADALVAQHAAEVCDPNDNLVARIKPTEERNGGDPHAT